MSVGQIFVSAKSQTKATHTTQYYNFGSFWVLASHSDSPKELCWDAIASHMQIMGQLTDLSTIKVVATGSAERFTPINYN